MMQKELTKTFMMISNFKPFGLHVLTIMLPNCLGLFFIHLELELQMTKNNYMDPKIYVFKM